MRMKSNNSKRDSGTLTRIVLAFSCFTVLLLIIFVVLFRVSKANVLSIGKLNSSQVAQNIEYYLVEEIDEIALTAQTVAIMQEQGKSNEEILDYFAFESSIVTDAIDENYTGMYGYVNGEYMDGSGWVPEEGYDPVTRPWYIDACAGEGDVVYVTPYLDSQTGTIMMSVCKMLPDKKSVVALDVSMDRIQQIVDSDEYKDYDQIIITDKNNIVVASIGGYVVGDDITDDLITKAYLEDKNNVDLNGYYEYRNQSGEKFSVFYASVEQQWNVFMVKKNRTLMRSLRFIYAILINGTIVFIIVGSWIYDYINKRRKAAEILNIQLESIADIYISVHKFDIEHDKIEEVRCMPFVREQKRIVEQNVSGAQEILRGVMRAFTLEEHWEAMKEFIDFNTLDARVGDSKTIALEFFGVRGWTKARIVVLERKFGKITSFIWMVEDIDQEKKKLIELLYLSETDLMTGIKNRGCGERLIKEQLAQNISGMFCMMDADKFKSINDNYGHDVGDDVIKAIADCLKNTFTSEDIVLRLGGDEFAVFAVGIENEEQSKDVIQRLVNAVEQVNIPAFKGKRKIQVSIGASFVTADNMKDFEELYKEADNAVYQSKKIEGSCVSYFSR